MNGLPLLASWRERDRVLSEHIRQHARNGARLHILEAGCGQWWGLDLSGVAYTLTGVDSDSAALEHRQKVTGDLDTAILGDLRTVTLDAGAYDAIYCAYVLEHIYGAAALMARFVTWLKPGGLLLVTVPDRDSAFVLLTRLTPFWLHVL
jgi:2-polyprenyl-3-methyl-5-hydroxy-6-metoxy-1,4-benzoquinol methylase